MLINVARDERAWYVLLFVVVFLFSLGVSQSGNLVTPDSISYLSAAQSFASGQPMVGADGSPYLHWPPVMPILLSPVYLLFNGEYEIVTRFLYAVVHALLALLTAYIVRSVTNDDRWALGSGLFMAIWYPVVYIHSWVLSEPVFMLWWATSIISFIYFSTSGKKRWIVALIVAGALGAATRFSGLFLIVGMTTALWFIPRASRRNRFWSTVLYAVGASLPAALWILSTTVLSGHTDRAVVFRAFNMQSIVDVAQTMMSAFFIVPDFYGGLVLVAAFTALLIVVAKRVRRADDAVRSLVMLISMSVMIYIALLLFTTSFIDATTQLNMRHLMPVLYGMLLCIVCVAHRWIVGAGSRFMRRSVFAIFATVVLVHACGYVYRMPGIAAQYVALHQLLGYVSSQSRITGEPVVYSNAPDIIFLATGRRTLFLPVVIDAHHDRPHPDFQKSLARFMEDMKKGGAAVYFASYLWRSYVLSPQQLSTAPNLVETYRDGYILVYQAQ